MNSQPPRPPQPHGTFSSSFTSSIASAGAQSDSFVSGTVPSSDYGGNSMRSSSYMEKQGVTPNAPGGTRRRGPPPAPHTGPKIGAFATPRRVSSDIPGKETTKKVSVGPPSSSQPTGTPRIQPSSASVGGHVGRNTNTGAHVTTIDSRGMGAASIKPPQSAGMIRGNATTTKNTSELHHDPTSADSGTVAKGGGRATTNMDGKMSPYGSMAGRNSTAVKQEEASQQNPARPRGFLPSQNATTKQPNIMGIDNPHVGTQKPPTRMTGPGQFVPVTKGFSVSVGKPPSSATGTLQDSSTPSQSSAGSSMSIRQHPSGSRSHPQFENQQSIESKHSTSETGGPLAGAQTFRKDPRKPAHLAYPYAGSGSTRTGSNGLQQQPQQPPVSLGNTADVNKAPISQTQGMNGANGSHSQLSQPPSAGQAQDRNASSVENMRFKSQGRAQNVNGATTPRAGSSSGKSQVNEAYHAEDHPLKKHIDPGIKEEGAQRINPVGIPRPHRNTAIEPTKFRTHGGGSKETPPPACSHYIVEDRGSASPRYIRSTLAKYPNDKQLLKDISLPLAVAVQPLGRPRVSAGENDIQLVDFRANGPVRCRSCGIYMNAFATWGQFSKTWCCNFCGEQNETPEWYQSSTDSYGRRHDQDIRPELHQGSYEMLVPKAFFCRSFVPNPTYVFCVEATAQAVLSGALRASLDAIKSSVDCLQKVQPNIRVAFVAFDGILHFFSFGKDESEAIRRFEVVDVENPCCPIPVDSWAMEVQQHGQSFIDGMDAVAGIFENTTSVQSTPMSAVVAAVDGLEETGGRVFVFQSSKVSCGIGQLPNREFSTQYVQSKDLNLLNMSSGEAQDRYRALAEEFNEKQVRIDFLIQTNQHVDVAYLATVAEATGGHIRQYNQFKPSPTKALHIIARRRKGEHPEILSVDGLPQHPDIETHREVVNEFMAEVARESGSEGAFRVRCSKGANVKQYYGTFLNKISPVVDIPALSDNQQLMVELDHDGSKLEVGDYVYVQAAFLYSSQACDRRVRVHTLALPVSDDPSTLFKNADMESVLTFLTHTAIKHMESSEDSATLLDSVYSAINDKCMHYLSAYRQRCTLTPNSGQLILPETLKHLPLAINALLKTDAFLPNNPVSITNHMAQSRKGGDPFQAVTVRSDARLISLYRLKSLPCRDLIPYCYPRIFDLTNLNDNEGYIFDEVPANYKQTILSDGYNKIGIGAPLPRYDDGEEATEAEYVSLPPSSWPSLSRLSVQGIHLLECEKGLFLYVGRKCLPEHIQELFGEDFMSNTDFPAEPLPPSPRNTKLSIRFYNIVGEIRREREPYLPLRVVVDHSPFAPRFSTYMREDALSKSRPSYCEHLCRLHTEVNNHVKQNS